MLNAAVSVKCPYTQVLYQKGVNLNIQRAPTAIKRTISGDFWINNNCFSDLSMVRRNSDFVDYIETLY